MVPPRWRRTWLALLGILASYQASKRRNLIVRDDLVIVKEEVHWSKKKKGVVSQMRRDVFKLMVFLTGLQIGDPGATASVGHDYLTPSHQR